MIGAGVDLGARQKELDEIKSLAEKWNAEAIRRGIQPIALPEKLFPKVAGADASAKAEELEKDRPPRMRAQTFTEEYVDPAVRFAKGLGKHVPTALGAAGGSLLGPAGAVAGAMLGGATPAAVSAVGELPSLAKNVYYNRAIAKQILPTLAEAGGKLTKDLVTESTMIPAANRFRKGMARGGTWEEVGEATGDIATNAAMVLAAVHPAMDHSPLRRWEETMNREVADTRIGPNEWRQVRYEATSPDAPVRTVDPMKTPRGETMAPTRFVDIDNPAQIRTTAPMEPVGATGPLRAESGPLLPNGKMRPGRPIPIPRPSTTPLPPPAPGRGPVPLPETPGTIHMNPLDRRLYPPNEPLPPGATGEPVFVRPENQIPTNPNAAPSPPPPSPPPPPIPTIPKMAAPPTAALENVRGSAPPSAPGPLPTLEGVRGLEAPKSRLDEVRGRSELPDTSIEGVRGKAAPPKALDGPNLMDRMGIKTRPRGRDSTSLRDRLGIDSPNEVSVGDQGSGQTVTVDQALGQNPEKPSVAAPTVEPEPSGSRSVPPPPAAVIAAAGAHPDTAKILADLELNPDALLIEGKVAPGIKGKIYDAHDKLKMWVANGIPPRFLKFGMESGIVPAYYDAAARTNVRAMDYAAKIATPEVWAQMKNVFKDPMAQEVGMAIRDKKPLDPDQAAWLKNNEGTGVRQFLNNLYGFYDETRGKILRKEIEGVGDLGETYIPFNFSSMGDVLVSLGKNWRDRSRYGKGIEKLRGNLQMTRTTHLAPRMNLAEVGEKYLHQVAGYEEMRPTEKGLKLLMKEYEKKGRGVEAEYIKDFVDGNSGASSKLDLKHIEAQLRKISNEPSPKIGDTFTGDGHWLPEGEIKVVRQTKSGKFRVTVDGVPYARAVPDVQLIATKYAHEPVWNGAQRTADALNKLASYYAVGGRFKPFFENIGYNAARVMAEHGPSDLATGTTKFKEAMKDPATARKLEAYGVIDNSLRAATENPAHAGKMGAFDKIWFSSVTGPDKLVKGPTFYASMERLMRENPERYAGPKGQEKLWKDAGMWTSKLTDMTVDGLRSPWSAQPIGKLGLFLRTAPARDFLLMYRNWRDGNLGAVARQVGIRVPYLVAINAAAGGDAHDAISGILGFFPVVGAMLQGYNGVGVSALDIGGKAASKVLKGDFAGAMPGAVRQFYRK